MESESVKEQQETTLPSPPLLPIEKVLCPPKLGGYEFYRKVLKSPKYIVAPMVDASELPWRILCRRYKAELCYTPMLHSKNMVECATYRKKFWTTCPEDRPLVVQFCSHDPQLLLQAALSVQDSCEAVDINFGCPQNIAKRGYYGAYLLENWSLIESLVSILHQNLSVPVFCKMRILPSEEKTIELAQLFERAGCQLLCVHGRTKEEKGAKAPDANWEIIKKIKNILSIPVIANGSIARFSDIERCLQATEADGVMIANANLFNPSFFLGGDEYFAEPKVRDLRMIELIYEYLELCEQYPVSAKMIKSHIFKMLKKPFTIHIDLRNILNDKKTKTVSQIHEIVSEMENRIKNDIPFTGVAEEKICYSLEPGIDREDIFEMGLFDEIENI